MIAFSLKQLAKITGGKLYGDDQIITKVTTNSNHIGGEIGCLFIALKGKRFDAHNFIINAINNGCVALMVSNQSAIKIAQVVVPDTRIALGNIASWVRQQSTAKIIAITGSSGKTSVKEMTAAILKKYGNTLCTYDNFNNDIGVSLTLLRLTVAHQFAVIEIGANHPGEIDYISALTHPNNVLVNNVSAAHIEGFGSLTGVAKAKGEIFKHLDYQSIAILNQDSNYWLHWKHILKDKIVWRFSCTSKIQSDFYASNIVYNLHGTKFVLHSPQGKCLVNLKLLGLHNISNALAASALALSVGTPLSIIQQGLNTFKPIPGRLFPIVLTDKKLLIDDSYNANVHSMFVAVQTLIHMPGYRVMIVGDIGELGENSIQYHHQIGIMISHTVIDKVLSIGLLSQYISYASGVGEHFNDKTTLSNRAITLISKYNNITVLVKGSRSTKMEQVVQTIKEKNLC